MLAWYGGVIECPGAIVGRPGGVFKGKDVSLRSFKGRVIDCASAFVVLPWDSRQTERPYADHKSEVRRNGIDLFRGLISGREKGTHFQVRG